jgi:hypothetical protein
VHLVISHLTTVNRGLTKALTLMSMGERTKVHSDFVIICVENITMDIVKL